MSEPFDSKVIDNFSWHTKSRFLARVCQNVCHSETSWNLGECPEGDRGSGKKRNFSLFPCASVSLFLGQNCLITVIFWDFLDSHDSQDRASWPCENCNQFASFSSLCINQYSFVWIYNNRTKLVWFQNSYKCLFFRTNVTVLGVFWKHRNIVI